MTNCTLKDEEFRSFLKTLGTRIRLLRKSKGFQMRDIMIKAGYYDAQWRKYEAGGSLNISSLMKIALALEVTLSELLDGLGEWPKLSVAEIQAANDIVPTSESAPKPEAKSVQLPVGVSDATNAAKQPVKKPLRAAR
jgi:transcriptional regulator with XRE-family HTH domain